jgi:hypothetical protein
MKAPFAIAAGVASIVGMISTSMADPSVGLSKVYESTTAGAPESIVYDAVSAMSFFRTLTGQWNNSPMEGDRAGGSAATAHVNHGYGTAGTSETKTSVKTIAAGSVVEWASFEGTPFEMITMLHMDGPNKLFYTHFCAAKNVPVMQFQKTGKPGEIKFDFVGGQNLNPAVDTHAHAVTFQIVDTNTIIQDLTTYSGGKPTFARSIYKRYRD